MSNVPIAALELSQLERDIIFHMHEKLSVYETILLDRWFPITSLDVPAVIGSFCITSKQAKKRWIIRPQAHDIGAGWCTPGDIARDYLKVKFPNYKPRITTAQYQEVIAKKRLTPVYCEPFEGDLVYVDIVSAYWNILRTTGWKPEYSPGRYLSREYDVTDFPYHYIKMARNSLVTVGMTGSIQIYDGRGNLKFVKRPNPFVNTMLWATVCDVLNGVAHDAIVAGAKYVYTDGYICHWYDAKDVIEAVERWGLPAQIKWQGRGVVKAPGAYRIGEHQSKPFELSRNRAVRAFNPVHVDWLRKKFREWSIRVNYT